MFLRVCLLKLGTGNIDGLRIEEAIVENLGKAALAHCKVKEKRAL